MGNFLDLWLPPPKHIFLQVLNFQDATRKSTKLPWATLERDIRANQASNSLPRKRLVALWQRCPRINRYSLCRFHRIKGHASVYRPLLFSAQRGIQAHSVSLFPFTKYSENTNSLQFSLYVFRPPIQKDLGTFPLAFVVFFPLDGLSIRSGEELTGIFRNALSLPTYLGQISILISHIFRIESIKDTNTGISYDLPEIIPSFLTSRNTTILFRLGHY